MGANTRYASPGTTFQFHGVARRLNDANYTSSTLRDTLSLINSDETVLSGIWKGHIKLEDAEATSFLEGEHVHDCKWAINRGLIKEIRDLDIPAAAIGRIKNVT
jgi:hypothetical protein